jgi:Fe2+ or Zn2+ uptake regulation protein
MDTEIETLFASNRLRITTSRKAILSVFKNAAVPLSPVEIVTANPDIDKVSIYRTIEIFERIGLISSVAHGWKQRYELAAPFRPHHHHLLCTHCGAIEEIQSDTLETMINFIAEEHAFEVTGHTFEVSGLCRNCKRLKEL